VTNSFLKAVIDKAPTDKYPLSNICFILPSQRAGIELKRIIAERETKTIRLPQTTTLNSWKEEISGLYPAERSELYLYLYQAYLNIFGQKGSSLDKFMIWADILLADFNDIDNQLLDSKQVFKDLKAYAEIEHFSFLSEKLSERQQNYRKFWMSLADIYEGFTKSLKDNSIGHSGLIGRIASERVGSYLQSNEFHYIIAGFNALSTSEQQTLKAVMNQERGEVYFDCDPIYFSKKHLKAGHFVRKFQREKFGEVIEGKESLLAKHMDVRIIHCPDVSSQAQTIVEEILAMDSSLRKETALILPDEDFLIHLLSVFPRGEIEANITMGISLRNSLFYSWLEKILNEDDSIQLSNHPFILSLQRQKDLQKTLLWKEQAQSVKNLEQFELIITELNRFLGSIQDPELVEKQAALACLKILKIINQVKLQGGAEFSAYKSLFLREVAQSSLNIISEPEKRLQVMGLLESRSLGFKNIIICSALEEFLPGKLRSESFMPFEIRKHHGLPGNYLKEAAFAYNFYRLTHDAESMTIIHYDKDNTLSAGEKSRYINQIIYDISRENQNINVEEVFKKTPPPEYDQVDPEIEKTPEVISQIKDYLKRGVSASSINRYFEDPLEWYYGYVLKLDEPERDILDVAGFGTIVHECLEILFEPFEKEYIHSDTLKMMKSKAPGILKEVFEKKLQGESLQSGQALISMEMAGKMVQNYLSSEIKEVEKEGPKLFIEGEIRLQRETAFKIHGESVRVKFVGQADKVEENQDTIYIVDYKTGKVESSKLTVEHWDIEEIRKNPKSLQLFLYQYLAKTKWPEQNTVGQIISLPAPSNRDLLAKVKQGNGFDEAAFEAVLKDIFSEMLNKDLKISKDPKFRFAVFET
jgi:hypothetical protein